MVGQARDLSSLSNGVALSSFKSGQPVFVNTWNEIFKMENLLRHLNLI